MSEEKLPGEGKVVFVKKTRKRFACEECGEPATKKHTFLLQGTRSNPASSAYGRNDCTFCEDTRRFVCEKHNSMWPKLDGYEWCGTYSVGKTYASTFMYWDEEEVDLQSLQNKQST